ncbi:lytic transglycosylase domain-containing protein [Burkholderia pseudomallei]|uniref:transglycosylase SLT domain-containing protein n=1 Tax=pseudomallei group TaxID=111527 RepID=UPI000CA9AC25|nr:MULTISPECIES: lytic transglycosylase domain-containing protein [pseudomallei group]MCS6516232.1 lytic transglycosylase domain-containing protein [Burkholderia thailandensis]MCW0048996.1 lytic transglycosylase domain-containing protein [Burkholderia pseudomallei]PJO70120.1 lytic transglycosylase [Burkholderia thailandensis]
MIFEAILRALCDDILRTLRALAITIALVLVSALALTIACAPGAHAQVPADAARYKLELRRQAQLVWGLNAPISSFAAQIHQESRWRVDANSPVGAQGLAQIMPSTATWLGGLYAGLRNTDPLNPTWALRALVSYDKWLYDRVKAANPCERMAFALSGYNGGLGWVYKRKKLSNEPLYCFAKTCEINPGVTPSNQRENAEYPRRILRRHEPLYVRAGWGIGSCTP